jgi:hypothetical protein
MTPIEALIINQRGWTDCPIHKKLYNDAQKVIDEEKDKIYLRAQRDQLERELNEINKKIEEQSTPF